MMLLPMGSTVLELKERRRRDRLTAGRIHSGLVAAQWRRWRSSQWTHEERCSTAQNEPQAERLQKPGEEIQTAAPIETEKKAKFTFFFF